jgi:hypothetical protein
MPYTILCFYAVKDLFRPLCRLATRKKRQSLATVPTHVGIWRPTKTDNLLLSMGVKPGVYTEAIVSGVHQSSGGWPLNGLVDARLVPIEDEIAFDDFLNEQVGKPYDYTALAFDVFGVGLPRWMKLQDERTDQWDCSRIATGALRKGKAKLLETRVPESPNDLREWCRKNHFTNVLNQNPERHLP